MTDLSKLRSLTEQAIFLDGGVPGGEGGKEMRRYEAARLKLGNLGRSHLFPLAEALEAVLGSEVYADAEGALTVEYGGCDDREHRKLTASATKALKELAEALE